MKDKEIQVGSFSAGKNAQLQHYAQFYADQGKDVIILKAPGVAVRLLKPEEYEIVE